MYTKNNGSGENNVIQNRFTAYLLTAIHRKKATYLGACSKRREMELPTDPDDIVSVLDAMVNSAGDAPSPFPLFENDALEEALQKLSQLRVELPAAQVARCGDLFAAANSFSQHPACMLRVMDWQAFLQVLLQYKASHQPLTAGRRVLDIAQEARLSIACEGARVSVKASADRADMSLEAQAAVRLTTLPLSRALYPDHPFLDWFPVDFYLPLADSF